MYNFPKIKFGKKDFYIVDNFEYKGVKYYYIIEDVYTDGMDISKFDGDIEINFIFKNENKKNKYENVVDDKLFDELLQYASKRIFLNKNKLFNNFNGNS